MDYKKYKNPGDWYENIRNLGFSIPGQAIWALRLEMEAHNLSFPEAYEKFIKEEWLTLVNKTYIFDMSCLTKLLEIKNQNIVEKSA